MRVPAGQSGRWGFKQQATCFLSTQEPAGGPKEDCGGQVWGREVFVVWKENQVKRVGTKRSIGNLIKAPPLNLGLRRHRRHEQTRLKPPPERTSCPDGRRLTDDTFDLRKAPSQPRSGGGSKQGGQHQRAQSKRGTQRRPWSAAHISIRTQQDALLHFKGGRFKGLSELKGRGLLHRLTLITAPFLNFTNPQINE